MNKVAVVYDSERWRLSTKELQRLERERKFMGGFSEDCITLEDYCKTIRGTVYKQNNAS